MENQNITEQTTASVPVNDAIEQGPDEAQQTATQQTAAPQTSTDTTAAQQQPQTATDKYYYMTPDGVCMYVIPKELIGKYNYKELTGGNAKDKSDFEGGVKNAIKEPSADFTATTTFNFEKLQEFFKVVKTLGAEHITINLKTNAPMKITAINDEGEEVNYWIAPYITE